MSGDVVQRIRPVFLDPLLGQDASLPELDIHIPWQCIFCFYWKVCCISLPFGVHIIGTELDIMLDRETIYVHSIILDVRHGCD